MALSLVLLNSALEYSKCLIEKVATNSYYPHGELVLTLLTWRVDYRIKSWSLATLHSNLERRMFWWKGEVSGWG